MAVTINGSSGLTANDGSVFTDASGNVGIGTSSPQANLQIGNADVSSRSIVVHTANNGDARLRLREGGTVGSGFNEYSFGMLGASNAMTWESQGLGEVMRINSSGALLVGTTSMGNTHAYFERISLDRAVLNLGTSSTAPNLTLAQFRNPNGVAGRIEISASSTAYTTSSDYRLKHDIQPMIGALAKVAQLKPVTYKWNADDSESQGFIAHELQAVVPECVTGEKDAVDAEGKPQYQGIDTSFLVATLTAAIKEQQAIITALTARVEALEGAQA
jgi:hypothetical protein